MARSYTQQTIKLLFGAAANRCSHPDCKVELAPSVGDPPKRALIGEMAHIVAHRDDGPRGDARLPVAERDAYDNLILLCPNHHTSVDATPEQYPATMLRRWKAEHEAWVERELGRHVRRVSFAELAVVTRALVDGAVEPSTDFDVLDPRSKMKRNGLGARTDRLLRMGLAGTAAVRVYLVHHASLDPDFPERLKARFVSAYHALREQGLVGDDIFAALVEFAQQGATTFDLQAAALTVVCYLFETCEIFER